MLVVNLYKYIYDKKKTHHTFWFESYTQTV